VRHYSLAAFEAAVAVADANVAGSPDDPVPSAVEAGASTAPLGTGTRGHLLFFIRAIAVRTLLAWGAGLVRPHFYLVLGLCPTRVVLAAAAAAGPRLAAGHRVRTGRG
jgi:hypothetical protein